MCDHIYLFDFSACDSEKHMTREWENMFIPLTIINATT